MTSKSYWQPSVNSTTSWRAGCEHASANVASGLHAFAARVQEQTTLKSLPPFLLRQAHLITCDDQVLRRARRVHVGVHVQKPTDYVQEWTDA
jgi:hypothetical protein